MPTHKEVYQSHAEEYEALVSREDHQGNILRVLRQIIPPEGLNVLDLGSGTGRLAGLLAPFARSVLAFDLSHHMLRKASAKFEHQMNGRIAVAVADHRFIPVASGHVDLVVSGWSVSYVAAWHPDTWREEAEAWLREARRLLRPGGAIVLLESLGTGNELPQRLPHLDRFYDWLDERGFDTKWIRTDYRFESMSRAEGLVEFFFGAEMKAHIRRGDDVTLPECTGVWWMRV